MRPSAGPLTGDVADRYAIEGVIGRGRVAHVYRARDRARGIDIALKLMDEDAMTSLSTERFLMEIRRTAKLPHPDILPVLDSGETDGRPYFVLPFMDGGTLRGKLLPDQPMPLDAAIALGIAMAKALECAHAHGVIHRDIKPENILFRKGQPSLADIGTTRALERSANGPLSPSTATYATSAYTSPELSNGARNCDGRADIYSLGCVLEECVAGTQPFELRSNAPVELEHILAKAKARSPGGRYQRAGELASALEALRELTVPANRVKTSRNSG